MAIHTDALSQVYARSLYELAEEAGGLEKIFEIGDELEQICEMSRADREFREFLASPIIELTKRGESLGRMFRDRITDLALRFLLVVNSKRRLSHLEAINAAYDQLVQVAHGRVEVDVTTAAPVNEPGRELIETRIREAIGKEPALHLYTDPTMIGGIKLRIGDRLLDGSVSTRLRRLRQSLMSRGSVAVRERFDQTIQDSPGDSNGSGEEGSP